MSARACSSEANSPYGASSAARASACTWRASSAAISALLSLMSLPASTTSTAPIRATASTAITAYEATPARSGAWSPRRSSGGIRLTGRTYSSSPSP